MNDTSPFHDGELTVQALAGEAERAERVGAVIQTSIAPAAGEFIAQQRLLVVGSVDGTGTPWASVVVGDAGFVTSDSDGLTAQIDLTRCARSEADILWSNLANDDRIGTLLIELATRRRVRINGRVSSMDEASMTIAVEEAYQNCPKYIQVREISGSVRAAIDNSEAHESDALTESQAALIARSDTMFVASVAGSGRVDASHRGGAPGFCELLDGRTLRIPDYAGNSMFNTLGNVQAHPRTGLVFPDFESGRIVQVSGDGVIRFGEDDSRGVTGGTGRFWDLMIDRVREFELDAGVTWAFVEASPFNPAPTPTDG